MFKRQLFLFFIFLITLLAVSCILLINHLKQAEREYDQLMTNQLRTQEIKEPAKAIKQTRTQLSKQVLFEQNGQRLQTRLKSDCSELFFHNNKIIEKFDALVCIQQEGLLDAFQAGQTIRYLMADRASYSYKADRLQAFNVKLSRHRLPGTILMESLDLSRPFFQGKAKKVNVCLFQNSAFKAEGLQAIFSDLENQR
jgi:hypothetical protein